MQDFEERAQAIGGEIARAFPGFMEKAHAHRHIPHTVCTRAIMDAIEAHPDLNNYEFVDSLLRQSLWYATGTAPLDFHQALTDALKHCSLQCVKLAVVFAESKASIKCGRKTAERPGVCDSLVIMTALVRVGVFPHNEAALLNCYKRLMDEGLPWIATRAIKRVINGNPEAFARAVTAEPAA